MSIETLLEAAKFLELQALQQQKARGKKGKICGRSPLYQAEGHFNESVLFSNGVAG